MSLHSRKRTEMACSHCRQRKIKCESNKPNPCRSCQEKGKPCEYMPVAEDPKAVANTRTTPPAQFNFATGSSPAYSPANSPPYSPPPTTTSHHARSYSNTNNTSHMSQASSSRAYAQPVWPGAVQYPTFDQSHMQTPSSHASSYTTQPYLETAQTPTYQAAVSYPPHPQVIVANGMAVPVSDYSAPTMASSDWALGPSDQFSSGSMSSSSYGFHPHQQQSQQQYGAPSQVPAIPASMHYQGGYQQEQDAYLPPAQSAYAQYSNQSAPYQHQ